MPLWGAVEGTETLPKWLTTAQQKDVFANQSGWVVEAGSAMTGNGNTSADPEVLVAIKGLAGATGATGLGEATLQTVNFDTTAWSRAAGGTLSVTVRWNEAVNVAVSNPTLVVTNDSRSNHTLTYASGTGTHELTFTRVYGANNSAIHADDVLSVAAQNITLASSSTIKDTGSTPTNAERVISAGQGTACGTITATA